SVDRMAPTLNGFKCLDVGKILWSGHFALHLDKMVDRGDFELFVPIGGRLGLGIELFEGDRLLCKEVDCEIGPIRMAQGEDEHVSLFYPDLANRFVGKVLGSYGDSRYKADHRESRHHFHSLVRRQVDDNV